MSDKKLRFWQTETRSRDKRLLACASGLAQYCGASQRPGAQARGRFVFKVEAMKTIITQGEVWERGLHIEWMNRGLRILNSVDMSPEIDELERCASRIFGGRCVITVEPERDDD